MVERYRRATLPEATLIQLSNAWVACRCGEADWWYWEPHAVQTGIAPYMICLRCTNVVAQEPRFRIVASGPPFQSQFGAGRKVRLGRLP